MAWVDFSNTAGFASDGRGGISALTGSAYNTNDTLFTTNTVTGTTFLGTLTNVAVGRIICTSDGFWGVIQSFDATPAPDIITVDRWRKWGYPGSVGTPAANSDLIVYTNIPFGLGTERWVIDSLEIRKATAADTITLSDIYGNSIRVWTVGATAGPIMLPYNCGGPPYEGPQGWEIGGPFIVVTSAATTICTVNFRIISNR